MQKFERIVVIIFFVTLCASALAEELDVDSDVSRNLLEKARLLEQKQAKGVDSEEYHSGYDAGYNQAVMDLLRSKLLNDPTIKPKPRPVPQNRMQPIPQRQARPAPRQKPARSKRFSNLGGQSTQVNTPSPEAVRSLTTQPAVTPIQKPNRQMGQTSKPKPALARPVQQSIQAQPESAQAEPARPARSIAPGAVPGTIPGATVAIPTPGSTAPVVQPQMAKPISSKPASVQSSIEPDQTTTQAVATKADPAMPWLEKSRGFLHKQQWPSAIDAASRAIVANSKNADGFIYRSWARAENGDYHEAIEDASKAIQLDGENPLAYNNRAYAYELAKSPELAIMDYDFACKMGYQTACDTAKKLRNITKRNKHKVKQLTAKTARAFQQKNWSSVEQYASQILKIDSNNTDAYINRAVARTELGKYGKALNDCNNALIINPQLGVAYNNKGYVFELIGEKSKAALEYETACQLGIKQSCADFKRLKK